SGMASSARNCPLNCQARLYSRMSGCGCAALETATATRETTAHFLTKLAHYRTLESSHQHERRPEIRMPVRREPGVKHIQLGGPQRKARSLAFLHLLVEDFHEVGGSVVVDLPQTHHDARGTSIKKSPRKPDHALALDQCSQSGLAGGEHYQIGVQLQIENLVRPQNAVFVSRIFQRQNHPGPGRDLLVQHRMG